MLEKSYGPPQSPEGDDKQENGHQSHIKFQSKLGRFLKVPVLQSNENCDAMKPMSFHERMEAYSLKADRADVILPAAEIFLIVSEALGCDTIRVPNISLADSIIDGLYKAEHHIR